MVAESLVAWARKHSENKTIRLIRSGEVIHFQAEHISTDHPLIETIIHAAYLYEAVEKDRERDFKRMEFLQKIEEGCYRPGLYMGYEPWTFKPGKSAEVVLLAYHKAADGMSLGEIAAWMNDWGYATIRGNPQTRRSVLAMLTNPVYVGDLEFMGIWIKDHHTPIVSRMLWERVQLVLRMHSSENVEEDRAETWKTEELERVETTKPRKKNVVVMSKDTCYHAGSGWRKVYPEAEGRRRVV